MPVTLSCPKCNTSLSVPSKKLGQTLSCPACSATFVAQAGSVPTSGLRPRPPAPPSRLTPSAKQLQPTAPLLPAARAVATSEDEVQKSHRHSFFLLGIFSSIGLCAALAFHCISGRLAPLVKSLEGVAIPETSDSTGNRRAPDEGPALRKASDVSAGSRGPRGGASSPTPPGASAAASPSTQPAIRSHSWCQAQTSAIPIKYPSSWYEVSYLPDGARLLVSRAEMPLAIFSAASLTAVEDLDPNREGGYLSSSATASPDGQLLAWLGVGKKVAEERGMIIFDVSRRSIRRVLPLQRDPIQRNDGSPERPLFALDGMVLVSAADQWRADVDTLLTLWNLQTGQIEYQMHGRCPVAYCAANGLLAGVTQPRSVAAGTGFDFFVALWDVRTGKEVSRISFRREVDYDKLDLLALSPDGTLLCAVFQQNRHTALVMDVGKRSQKQRLVCRTDSRSHRINDVAFAPDGKSLGMAGGDGVVEVWDLATNSVAVLNGHKDAVKGISFSPDSQRLVTISADKTLRSWEAVPGVKGEFVFRAGTTTDAIAARSNGPNGEPVFVGGDGLGTRWYFHYYLDKDGKKVLHGKSRVQLNGTGTQESNYDLGVLLSRSCYDSKHHLEASYKRLADGNYQKDEYRTLSNGSTVQMRSVVSITETDTGETIREIKKRQIIANDMPLPSVPGRRLTVNIDTAGIEDMAFARKHNASLSPVQCVATNDQLVIDFDIDASQWAPVQQAFPLLVRLFDRNGQYLNHFTTAEGFTVFIEVFDTFGEIYGRFSQAGMSDEAAKYKCVLLKPKGNRLVYGVNVRDLRDASMVEIGFTER
jgi:uncharacterized protein YbaR (Trm112 family)